MNTTPTTYPVASYGTAREILHTLRQKFRTGGPRHSLHPLTWYDSFDWRLFRDGGTLSVEPVTQGVELRWCSLEGKIRHHLRLGQVPLFARDFPVGPFRERLLAVLGVRRLLPRVKAEFVGEIVQILDAADQVVAQVDLEEGTAEPGDGTGGEARVSPRVQLRPLEGSPEYYGRIVAFLESELGLRAGPCRRFDRAVAAVGLQPGDYSSRLDLTLDPAMPAFEAARRILLALLGTIRANEDGVRRGLDTEFLHDLRVAIRRTRTCLAQLKGVFHPDRTAHFRQEFGWLGEVTGPGRDLDVYLLTIPHYQTLLPADLRNDLAPLTRFLQKRRAAEQAHLVEMFGSLRYRRLLRDWSEFLSGPPAQEQPPAAELACMELANNRIAKRWKKVLKRGAAIRDDSEAADLHSLRIDCKRLRYLLEFFRSLYVPGELDPMVRKLRKLQDLLGEINDIEVQGAALSVFAREMDADHQATPESFLAMGRLQEQLLARQERERRKVRREFARFAGKKTRESMQRLVGDGEPRDPEP
ncbi:MAG TPA: CHAD domain-containing protein [Candidatus Polarisedimenticolia bacterium]|nr:CHAD domain-containing protein [Candidatus Polarisedimenticolia bacterium]